MFVAFEGCEASGKSTQIPLLADALRARGVPVTITREPGGSPGAEEIRNLVLSGDTSKWSSRAELLLFTAARVDHLEKTVLPALDAGNTVLCDRYVGSTYALQGAGGADTSVIDGLNSLIGIANPDLTIYLDISPKESFRRITKRLEDTGGGVNRFEEKGRDYHTRVHHIYDGLCQAYPDWVRFDASLTIEELHNAILNLVLDRSGR